MEAEALWVSWEYLLAPCVPRAVGSSAPVDWAPPSPGTVTLEVLYMQIWNGSVLSGSSTADRAPVSDDFRVKSLKVEPTSNPVKSTYNLGVSYLSLRVEEITRQANGGGSAVPPPPVEQC